MKKIYAGFLLGLLLTSCGKEETKPAETASEAKKAVAAPKPPAPKPPPPEAPQGKLPKMDPEKAKFIAVPSTPEDKVAPAPAPTPAPEVKQVDVTPKGEVKPTKEATAPSPPPASVPEVKKPAAAATEAPVVMKPAEVKPAEVIAKPAPPASPPPATEEPPPEIKKAGTK